MNPPIPDPFSGPPPRPAPLPIGPRPPALKTFIGIFVLSWIVWSISPVEADSGMSPEGEGVLGIGLTLFFVLVTRCLWLGQNWSRLAVMVYCCMVVLFMLDLTAPDKNYSTLFKYHVVLDGIFGATWFCWLRTLKVVAFFKGSSA